jgi:hypothetical protein
MIISSRKFEIEIVSVVLFVDVVILFAVDARFIQSSAYFEGKALSFAKQWAF